MGELILPNAAYMLMYSRVAWHTVYRSPKCQGPNLQFSHMQSTILPNVSSLKDHPPCKVLPCPEYYRFVKNAQHKYRTQNF